MGQLIEGDPNSAELNALSEDVEKLVQTLFGLFDQVVELTSLVDWIERLAAANPGSEPAAESDLNAT